MSVDSNDGLRIENTSDGPCSIINGSEVDWAMKATSYIPGITTREHASTEAYPMISGTDLYLSMSKIKNRYVVVRKLNTDTCYSLGITPSVNHVIV